MLVACTCDARDRFNSASICHPSPMSFLAQCLDNHGNYYIQHQGFNYADSQAKIVTVTTILKVTSTKDTEYALLSVIYNYFFVLPCLWKFCEGNCEEMCIYQSEHTEFTRICCCKSCPGFTGNEKDYKIKRASH